MSESDIGVLNDFLSAQRSLEAPDLSESEFFNLFAAGQVFRDIEVDLNDIQAGDVDGDGDGGIDFIFLVANGRLVRDVSDARDLKSLKQNVTIDLIIVQATLEPKFTLARVVRLKDTISDVLSIHRDPNDFSEDYNEGLLEAIEKFRLAHRVLATKRPTLNVSVFYFSKGDAEKIRKIPNAVKRKADAIESGAQSLLATVTSCTFTFVGTRELIELAYKPPRTTFNLPCVDSMPSPRGGYVSLVKIRDFFKFISADGTLIDHLFDSNVRDYQGDVDVNKAIRKTLNEPDPREDFWWLNNGITIVATKAGGDLRDLIIDDPRIVNGLQTSQEIFDYFDQKPNALLTDERLTLIRTIAFDDAEIQDRIIEATNSQTGMQPASLWATDPIHRHLETLFKKPEYGLFYDRRKNYWRNRQTPLSKVVGITDLAQSILAIVLQEPDMARARPARYFKKTNKDLYKQVFNSKRYPLEAYPVCARLRKETERFLRAVEPDRQHRNNLLFYVLMTATCLITKSKAPRPKRIARIDAGNVSDAVLRQAFDMVRPIYRRMGATDKVAKGPQLVRRVKRRIERELTKSRVTTKTARKSKKR